MEISYVTEFSISNHTNKVRLVRETLNEVAVAI